MFGVKGVSSLGLRGFRLRVGFRGLGFRGLKFRFRVWGLGDINGLKGPFKGVI